MRKSAHGTDTISPHNMGLHMTMARRALLGMAALLLGSALGVATAADASKWVEGRHYTVLRPAQPTQVPAGKVEVTAEDGGQTVHLCGPTVGMPRAMQRGQWTVERRL
jgi:hypothetical protein